MDPRGAYSADRAAALSGVPKATVYYWARKEILVPSVSAERVRLWSYSDLLALRVIAWLRATKTAPDGQAIAPTTMTAVRTGLRELVNIDLTFGPRRAARISPWTAAGGLSSTRPPRPSTLADRQSSTQTRLICCARWRLDGWYAGPTL